MPGPTTPNSIAAANTGSTLAYSSGLNRTSTSLSTNIIILVGNTSVGAVQSISYTEQRPIKQIDEVGTDGHVDSVPNGSTKITGQCQRVIFDGMRVTEAFGRGFLHVSSQIYPFDIYILDKNRKNGFKVMTVLKNVWINNLSTTYNQSDWVITQQMSFEAESIFSVRTEGLAPGSTGSAQVSAATGGIRGIPHATFNGVDSGTQGIEQIVDTGGAGRRGALDAGGLIDLLGDSPDASSIF